MLRGIAVRVAAFCAAGALVLGPSGAGSQAYGDLALAWTVGDYRSPLLCEVDGTPFRVLRRIRVSPKRLQQGQRPTIRVQFYDLESPEETRCYSEEGAGEENLIGTLEVVHESRRDRTDIAEREFTDMLRREGGFGFKVKRGRLRMGTPGAAPESLAVVDFKGGSLEVHEVERGQDAYRKLLDFGERRKLTFRLKAPDGTSLRFDLAQMDGGPG